MKQHYRERNNYCVEFLTCYYTDSGIHLAHNGHTRVVQFNHIQALDEIDSRKRVSRVRQPCAGERHRFFYAAFGWPSSVGQLASSIPFKLSPTRFKHRNFDNEPHIHISCGKKKTKSPLFPMKKKTKSPCFL